MTKAVVTRYSLRLDIYIYIETGQHLSCYLLRTTYENKNTNKINTT